MKSRWTKWLLLLLTALWLPLQTITAFVMPLGLLASTSAQASQSEEAMPCHEHHNDADVTSPSDDADDTDQPDCGRCGVCHLAAAGYMPAAVMSPLILPAGHVLSAAPLRGHHSQVPEPLEDPPKRLS